MSGQSPLYPVQPGSQYLYTRIYGEDHTGNSGASIALAFAYVPLRTSVFFNGVRLRSGSGNDFEETSPSGGTITLLGIWAAPGPTDVVLVDYDKVT